MPDIAVTNNQPTQENLILCRMTGGGTYISTAESIGSYGIYLIQKFEANSSRFDKGEVHYVCRPNTRLAFFKAPSIIPSMFADVKSINLEKAERGARSIYLIKSFITIDGLQKFPPPTAEPDKSATLPPVKPVESKVVLPEHHDILFEEINERGNIADSASPREKKGGANDKKVAADISKHCPIPVTDTVEQALWDILLKEAKKQQSKLIETSMKEAVPGSRDRSLNAGWATALLAQICSKEVGFLDKVIKYGEFVERIIETYRPPIAEHKLGQTIQLILNPQNPHSGNLVPKLVNFFSTISNEHKILRPFFHQLFEKFKIAKQAEQIGVVDRNFSAKQLLLRLQQAGKSRPIIIGTLGRVHRAVETELKHLPKDQERRNEQLGLMKQLLAEADAKRDYIVSDRDRRSFKQKNDALSIRLNNGGRR